MYGRIAIRHDCLSPSHMSDTILTTLPNGLRLALHPMPATYSATIVAIVGTGSRYESDEGAGLSHFVEHMLFKGTERRAHRRHGRAPGRPPQRQHLARADRLLHQGA